MTSLKDLYNRLLRAKIYSKDKENIKIKTEDLNQVLKYLENSMFEEKFMEKVTTQKVCSADKYYMIWSFISIILAIAIQIGLFISSKTYIGAKILLELIVIVLIIISRKLSEDYKNRVDFNIYYCKLDSITDIRHIKNKYKIIFIDTYGAVFVDKGFEAEFNDWNLFKSLDSYTKVTKYFLTENN